MADLTPEQEAEIRRATKAACVQAEADKAAATRKAEQIKREMDQGDGRG